MDSPALTVVTPSSLTIPSEVFAVTSSWSLSVAVLSSKSVAVASLNNVEPTDCR